MKRGTEKYIQADSYTSTVAEKKASFVDLGFCSSEREVNSIDPSITLEGNWKKKKTQLKDICGGGYEFGTEFGGGEYRVLVLGREERKNVSEKNELEFGICLFCYDFPSGDYIH